MKKFLIIGLILVAFTLVIGFTGCKKTEEIINGAQPVMYIFDGYDFSTFSNWYGEIPGANATDYTDNDWEFYLEVGSLNYKVPGAGEDAHSQYRAYMEDFGTLRAVIKMWEGLGEEYDAIRVIKTPVGSTVDLTTVTVAQFTNEFRGIVIDLR